MPRPAPGSIPKMTAEQKAKRRGVLARLIKYVGGSFLIGVGLLVRLNLTNVRNIKML